MDIQLRELYRQYRQKLDDSSLQALVSSRRRASYPPATSEDLMLEQKEIQIRWREVWREMRESTKKFEMMCSFLFKEYPNFQLATILLTLPSFMDGDPLRPSGSLLISPKSFPDYGLIPHETIFADFDLDTFNADTNREFKIASSAPNAKLSDQEIQEIRNRLLPFYEFWQDYFGLNCRIDIYRNGFRGPNENNRWTVGDSFIIETQPYDCGY